MTATIVGLDLWTVLTIIIVVGVGPYIKRVTNNYFFWLVLGTGLFVYLMVGRFYEQLSDFAKNGNDNGIGTSRGLLLDICPFCAFSICIAIAVDPTRKFAKIIAPFAIFGGLITILGGIGDELQLSDVSTARYIFMGDSLNPMYFMMHYINVLVGSLVLVSVPKMRFADWIYCNLFAGAYYSYVAICMLTLHVQYNVSGLNINDWSSGGEYDGVATIFNSSPAVACALGFILSYSGITLIIFGSNRLQLMKRYRWYNMWNKEKWYIGWYQLKPDVIKEPKSLPYKFAMLIKTSCKKLFGHQ